MADCTERTLDHYLAASSTGSGITVPGLVNPKSASQSWTFTTEKKNGKKKIVLAPPLPPTVGGFDSDGAGSENDASGESASPFQTVDPELGSADDESHHEDEIIDEN